MGCATHCVFRDVIIQIISKAKIMKIVSAEYCRYTGLGNKLFPWARAKIFARKNSEYKMLCPFWFSPHGGAITRGGIDYAHALRKIWLLGNFIKANDEISLIQYFLHCRNVPLRKFIWLKDALPKEDSDHIVFAVRGNGMEGHDFTEFKGESEFLLRSLECITAPAQLKYVNKFSHCDYIGINIRCGNDFVEKDSGRNGFIKTRCEWFCNALLKIRNLYGNLPAIVVSDGGYKQLASLLKENNVILLNSKAAIADLLVLSRAKVLLASGSSSFSEWASFLGQMDTFSSVETPFIHGKGLEYGRNGEKKLELF